MRILVDEDVPVQIKNALADYRVETVQELGWGSCGNGELLSLAEHQFDVFITADKNLKYQQNLGARNIAVVELSTNKRRPIEANFPVIRQAIQDLTPRDFLELKIPE